MPTPLFLTPHSPVGAWASLTFGAADRGASIQHGGCVSEANVDLLVGVQRDGAAVGLPFVENPNAYPEWKFIGAEGVARTLTACVDEFVAAEAGLTLRVFTPHAVLPNPKRSSSLQYATAPGVLLEITIDNSASDSPATAFVGVGRKSGHLRAADWSSKTLCGVGEAGNWLLAAGPVKEEVFTIQSAAFARHLAAGTSAIEGTSRTGGIAIKAAGRMKKTVTLVLAFFNGGSATQGAAGLAGRYLYTAYFPRVETVANFMLLNQHKIRESCANFDGRIAAACADPVKRGFFARAMRAYEARTQLVDAEGIPYFTALDGAGHRNALDAAVDELPWMLFRNPWVIRNLFDLGTASYSYQDQVRFDGNAELRPGGLTFTRDCGLESCYTPSGTSASEAAGKHGAGAFMATESLLNGVYLLTSYALLADDTPWAKTRLPFARELLTSMENRDHWDPEQRNGTLNATSEKAGVGGAEVTAFAGCGGLLEKVPGNVYVAVKTFCANLMLTTYFQANNDLHSADYSYAFAQKTAAVLVAAFDREAGVLPANLLDRGSAGEKMIAALEPLAVPTYLGLTSTLAEYFPELFDVLKRHAEGCLQGGCVDAATGGLRLISSSAAVIPAKVVSVLYVLERLFGVDVDGAYPGLWRQVSAAAEIEGRGVSAAAFLRTPAVAKGAEEAGGAEG